MTDGDPKAKASTANPEQHELPAELSPELHRFGVHTFEPGHREEIIKAPLHVFEKNRIQDTVPPKARLAALQARRAAEAQPAEAKPSDAPPSARPRIVTERLVALSPAEQSALTSPDTPAAKNPPIPEASTNGQPPPSASHHQRTLLGVAPPPPAADLAVPPKPHTLEHEPKVIVASDRNLPTQIKIKLRDPAPQPDPAVAEAVSDGHAHEWELEKSDTGSIIGSRLVDGPETPPREQSADSAADSGQTRRRLAVFAILGVCSLILIAVLAKRMVGDGDETGVQSVTPGAPETAAAAIEQSPGPSTPVHEPTPSALIAPPAVPDSEKPTVRKVEPVQAPRAAATPVSAPPAVKPKPAASEKLSKPPKSVFSDSDLRPPLD